MTKIFKKKNAEGGLTTEQIITAVVLFLAAGASIFVFKFLITGEAKAAVQTINWAGDEDGDHVFNRDDKCCAAACNPAGFDVGYCPGELCGCAAKQGYTDCASKVCLNDYDHDHVNNEAGDRCCPAQCAPGQDETVDTNPVSQTYGCTPNQIILACDVADRSLSCYKTGIAAETVS